MTVFKDLWQCWNIWQQRPIITEKRKQTKRVIYISRTVPKSVRIAVITVEPPGKSSFVLGCIQTRLMGQYNGKWPISLVYMSKPLITVITAIFSLFLVTDARLRSNFKNSCFVFYRGFQTRENNKSTRPMASCFRQFACVWKPRRNTRFWCLYLHYMSLIFMNVEASVPLGAWHHKFVAFAEASLVLVNIYKLFEEACMCLQRHIVRLEFLGIICDAINLLIPLTMALINGWSLFWPNRGMPISAQESVDHFTVECLVAWPLWIKVGLVLTLFW